MARLDRRGSGTATIGGVLLVRLPTRGILLTLAGIVAFLLGAHLAVTYSSYRLGHDYLMGFARAFNLLRDANVPTWYSSSVLLLCAALAAIIGAGRGPTPGSYKRHWMGLSLVLAFMSMDEAAMIHETAQEWLRVGFSPEHWFYDVASLVLPGLLVIVVGAAYIGFVMALPRRTLWCFVVAAGMYVAGGLVLDFIGDVYKAGQGEANMTSAMLTGVEEVLEMTGVLVLLYGLLDHIERFVGPVALVVSSTRGRSGAGDT